jgi:putative MATE family efflux protein
MTGGALQAAGDSLTPLKAATVTRVIHLAFSPILIFGWLGFPEFGLPGAAIARLGAEWLGVTINMFALFKGSSRLRIDLKSYTWDFGLIWRLTKVGAPASVTNMQRALTQLVMVLIVAPFGDGALAAFALTRRTENLVNQGSRGLGRAAGALAGQNLGAGFQDRARSALRWAVIYAAGGSLSIAAIIIVFPEAVASFFNSDVEFVSLAARWVTIMAIGYFSISTVQVFTQGFNTSGATFAPMIITLATVWVVDIPLAYVLSHFTPLAEFGVPWAITIGMTLRLLAFVVYYFRGNWLKTGVM